MTSIKRNIIFTTLLLTLLVTSNAQAFVEVPANQINTDPIVSLLQRQLRLSMPSLPQ